MPFHIVRNDITKMRVDAVVNAANETLLGGGGVDGAIHRAAGPKLLERCRKLGGCRPGEAKLTPGFDLPARWIIHTVGPIWQGGMWGEEQTLSACYDASLRLAKRKGCKSVAFPLISAGAYGYPKAEALAVATDRIRAFLEENEMEVYLVVFDERSFKLSRGLADEIREYIDAAYAAAHDDRTNRRDAAYLAGANAAVRPFAPYAGQSRPPAPTEQSMAAREDEDRLELFFSAEEKPCAQTASFPKPAAPAAAPHASAPLPKASAKKPRAAKASAKASSPAYAAAAPTTAAGSLRDALAQLDESFSQMLLRKIDEKGMTDAACYKKANVDRKLFSKIRSDVNYHPSKVTAVAFAIALELPMEEALDLLNKAGFALSHASKFDIIIEYFIEHGNYNIYEINEALFAFDQVLLGA